MSPRFARTLLMVGVSHRTAAVAEREVVALSAEERRSLQRDWRGSGCVDECFVLTTCNRSEFYAVARDVAGAETALRGALARRRGGDVLAGLPHVDRRVSRQASRHLLRVAATLFAGRKSSTVTYTQSISRQALRLVKRK